MNTQFSTFYPNLYTSAHLLHYKLSLGYSNQIALTYSIYITIMKLPTFCSTLLLLLIQKSESIPNGGPIV